MPVTTFVTMRATVNAMMIRIAGSAFFIGPVWNQHLHTQNRNVRSSFISMQEANAGANCGRLWAVSSAWKRMITAIGIGGRRDAGAPRVLISGFTFSGWAVNLGGSYGDDSTFRSVAAPTGVGGADLR